ncbi:MAG: methyl-accepting chemotaxis protein [Methylococcales bacterium]|nr:methyl-accepting chemotaxis protein [Methylococcales bacterium]
MRTMNWNSIGVKVVSITMLTLATISIGLLVVFYASEKQKMIDQEIEHSNIVLQVSESIQENVLSKWASGIFSTELLKNMLQQDPEKAKQSILVTVPVANAWEALQLKAKEGGFRFKAPRVGARNPANEADAIEQQALQHFAASPSNSEYSYVDEEKQELRVFHAVRLSQQCEVCHGDPATSERLWGNSEGKDILGYKMENKHAGDLHGAFEIIKPLGNLYAIVNTKIMQAAFFATVGLLIIMATGYYAMSVIIISPLTNLALKLQDIASGHGDLKARLDPVGKSEFAWVAGSFNKFVKKIAKTVDEINHTSDQLTAASQQLLMITRSAMAGVDRQQAETTQVASAMEEMTATVQEVSMHAFKASAAAATADSDAVASKNIIHEAIKGIHLLASEVDSAAMVMKELESDSNSIGEVLSTIQGIAEQTNLLALNAAIEAARAGEQGRGFAVVADEVRTLASRTQNSTLEIQKTIERLQSRAEQASKVMENGKKRATASVEQAASSGVAMEGISAKIDSISDMNNHIASAAEEQSAVAKEINRNINNISQVTLETSSGVHKSAIACQELLELAQQLKASISQFRT